MKILYPTAKITKRYDRALMCSKEDRRLNTKTPHPTSPRKAGARGGIGFFLAAVLFLTDSSLLFGQQKQAANDGLVVDVITLKSGRTLRGAIAVQKQDGSLSMAVSRNWLGTANPTMSASALKETMEGQKSAWNQLRERISSERETLVDSPRLDFFYQQELERLDRFIAEPNPTAPDFVWIDVKHDSIAKLHRATPDQQRIALFAWNEKLNQVETRDRSSLQKELTNRGIKLDQPPTDLSEKMPARSQTDEEWATRVAIVEYAVKQPMDFQGMGQTVTRTGDGKAANLAEILPKLLQQQLGSLFAELTNEGVAPSKEKADSESFSEAIKIAEREGVRGFRVTRLDVDAAASRVTVESRFLARLSPGKWKTVWLDRAIEDGTKQRPQAEARIEQDPQLKTVVDTVKSLGLADGTSLKKAIRIGAATMSAQQAADTAFAGFQERYSRHLDAPPLPVMPIP